MDRPEAISRSSAPAPKSGSIAKKYSLFTAFLLGWVCFIFVGYDLARNAIDIGKLLFLVISVGMAAMVVSKFTNNVLARPLRQLQRGIMSVQQGRLEPIPLSRTGDEVEYLGESLNQMIAVLKASKEEVRQYQETLTEKIRQRTEALEEATQRALAASRAKSEFLANVSHELRTPMNGVLGMIDIMLDDSATPAQRDHLETAKSCANTLLALLNDILDLSKIEAGRMLLEEVPFPISDIVADCAKSMIPQCRQKGIELRTMIAPEVPWRVVGDPLRVRQILTNLLSNAVKFTSTGWVEVRLSVARGVPSTDDGRIWLRLEVADTGGGIAPEKQKSIFDEFTQADGSISRKYGGTGLGLAITRRLVEMHKGAITLQSAVGRGSTFGASLYLRQCVEAGEAEPTLSEGKPAQRTWVRNRMAHPRVLVAEDNVVNQKVVRKILEKRGYEVLVANNGLEALALLERESFDVVLMDVQMPELDGIVATRRIRANPRWQKLPIIAMTAHAMNGDRERCLNAGMDSYLSKPVSAAHLTATIDQWIREKSEPVEVEIPAPPSGVPEKVVAMGDNLQMFDSKNLMTGLTMLFLQVAPEHMQRIHSAVVREDWATLRNQSKRLERAAERISASSIASLASQIAMHAGNADLAPVQNLLMELEEELRGLEREMGEAEPERVAS